VKPFGGQELDAREWAEFAAHLSYVAGDLNNADDYQRLHDVVGKREGEAANRVYYLATLPEFFAPVAKRLGELGMADEAQGFRRIVVEKPFGQNLPSAEELNDALRSVFEERQIFRMDHYLGKETSQNILFFRFANTIFEPIWNRNYVDNVQIAAVEKVEVEQRGAYYDETGVLRDMFQNHLLQLLCLVAMEPPASFDPEMVRNEKIKLLSAVESIALTDTVRGQYEGYRQAENVASDSVTATYGALKLYVDNWRWQGVPFYLRSGKSLAKKISGVIVQFDCPPHVMFNLPPFASNLLSFCIQPDEGVHLRCEVKVPESEQETRPVSLGFHYRSYFGPPDINEAYERLVLDVLRGDTSLFPRADAIEAAWRVIDPVVQGWESASAPPLTTYEPGVWGPPEADELLGRDDRCWIVGCQGEGEECADS